MKSWFGSTSTSGNSVTSSSGKDSGSQRNISPGSPHALDGCELEAASGVLVSHLIAAMEVEMDISANTLAERLELQRMSDLMREGQLKQDAQKLISMLTKLQLEFVECVCEASLAAVPSMLETVGNTMAKYLPDEIMAYVTELLDVVEELMHRVENMDVVYLQDKSLAKFIRIAVAMPALELANDADTPDAVSTEQYLQNKLMQLLVHADSFQSALRPIIAYVTTLKEEAHKISNKYALSPSIPNSSSSSSSKGQQDISLFIDGFVPFIDRIKNSCKKKLRESLTNPRFNRAYGYDMHKLAGYVHTAFNPIPYGPSEDKMVYYYCPLGWRRVSLQIADNFDDLYGTWHIGYAGLKHENIIGVLSEGLKIDDYYANTLRTQEHYPPLVFTPSIFYAQHPQFSSVYKINGKYCQCLLMCRINNAVMLHNSPQPASLQMNIDSMCDPNYPNTALEFVVSGHQAPDVRWQSYVIYAIIFRVLDHHPRDLAENAWIPSELWS